MRAEYIANRLLALKGNPQVFIVSVTKESSAVFRHDTLNFSLGNSPEGFVELIRENWVTRIIKEKKMIDPLEDCSPIFDHKKVINALLENKKVLPAFIGVDKNFDKIIAEKLKEK